MKISMKYKNILVAFLLLLGLPALANAMTIELEKPVGEVGVNDVVSLNVYLDTEGKEINAIDGKVTLTGDFEIRSVSTAGSVFDLWPNKPSVEGDDITFVGGTTSGVFGSRLRVFSVAIKPLGTETVSFSAGDIEVFLNDGVGTKVVATGKPRQIVVLQNSGGANRNDLEKLILEDKTQPKEFKVYIGRDASLHDGKYFASFNTTDAESGIDRYEVIEGDNPVVRSGNTYVLMNQSLDGELTVRAIDMAGNVRSVTSNMADIVSEHDPINWGTIIIAVLLMLIIFYTRRYIARKHAQT
jgi:hypothetical protein